MCGIVGYVGSRDAASLIYEGLERLEYRGYDSAGLAVISNGRIEVRRDAGKISSLRALLQTSPVEGTIGVGHTRWATHGKPCARNAHPQLGSTGEVAVVHNGIIENYLELQKELAEQGVQFKSETDTEIIVQLVERHLAQGFSLSEAARRVIARLEGAHAIVLISAKEPDRLVVARLGYGGGVTIGIGDGEMFLASDIPAILNHTRQMVFLEPGQYAVIQRDKLEVHLLNGESIPVKVQTVEWESGSADKGTYDHYTLKEINEQPYTIASTIGGRVDFTAGQIRLPELNLTPEKAARIKRIIITACGTAAHAGMVGKILIERIARLPVEVDIASEFRYREPIVDEDTAVIAISQSGETADTLAAMAEARKRKAILWGIVNAIGSQAMRMADGCIPMKAGPEIGVASTKAYIAPLVDLYMLAVLLAEMRGNLEPAQRMTLVRNLYTLPDLVSECVARQSDVQSVAPLLKDIEHCLFMGRGIQMPTAYEGALKLKEISYIHAEGYPAGEMKHGPIALIDREMPVVAIVTRDPWYEKMIGQVEQVKARGGLIIAVATDGDERIPEIADEILWVPDIPWMLSPVTAIIPLQLLAYQTALLRGADVDQPRNLAKSVTVE